jgi:diketogulonate reductase-like aldo/keto reductase
MSTDKTIPNFFYGTAWKEEQTEKLTLQALDAGFVAIDTANQRKHYYEEAVGKGIASYLKSKKLDRDSLFLQTKFTFARGQDHRKPYNEKDGFAKQVEDSFKSSLEHLQTDYIDSYVLHGPYENTTVSTADHEAWAAMESLQTKGKVKHLGVSNVSLSQLEILFEKAKVKPRFVQNRCYARTNWDKDIREFCKAKNIMYQGFSLLTANKIELASAPMELIATKYKKSIAQIVFRFCYQIGMISLTGTSSMEHMRQDLNIMDFELTPSEMQKIEGISSYR